MKVYDCPAETPAPKPDFANYDREAELAKETRHKAMLKEWLQANGYDGPMTGEVASFGVADGAALYMFADAGRGSALIHLPYGDGYHYRDVVHLPRAEVVRRIEAGKKLASIFGRRDGEPEAPAPGPKA